VYLGEDIRFPPAPAPAGGGSVEDEVMEASSRVELSFLKEAGLSREDALDIGVTPPPPPPPSPPDSPPEKAPASVDAPPPEGAAPTASSFSFSGDAKGFPFDASCTRGKILHKKKWLKSTSKRGGGRLE
jgi:hypothetical protein